MNTHASIIGRKQDGAVLITALLLLLVMTLLGLSGARTTTLEEKMAGNMRDRHRAFQAAEAALREGERLVENHTFTLAELQNDSCTGSYCFKHCGDTIKIDKTTYSSDGSAAGYCFRGSFTGTAWKDCEDFVFSSAELTDSNYATIWNTSRHLSYTDDLELVKNDPKFIIEFMCYTKTDPDAPDPDATAEIGAEFSEVFRISAIATGVTTNARVMVQSTYKKPL
jgi:type IV pilus assembly protein PilX